MTTGVTDTRAAAHPRPARAAARPRPPAPTGVTTAMLLATARAADGGPAAALPWEGGTLLGRLLDQLASLGVVTAHVAVRPDDRPGLAGSLDVPGVSVVVHECEDPAADLRAVAAALRAAPAGVVVASADVVTHREALAGLLADPRVPTGVLTTTGRRGRPWAFRVRGSRGRLVAAASPYHRVANGNQTFLGVMKVAAPEVPALAAAADRLSGLVSGPLPPGWEEELESTVETWRAWLARSSVGDRGLEGDDEPEREADDALGEEDDEPQELAAAALSPEDEARIAHWRRVAPHDVAALLLVGLVRSGAYVGRVHLRKLFWARPLSAAEAAQAAVDITGYDEDKVLLDSAVKASDGFFTTFFVSPYSRYIARWAARRGFTPNQVTTVSVLIGVLAAAAFATGETWGMLAGAVLLQLSFTTDCVDGQLARYTRQFSKLGAYLDSIFDRTKEYVVLAGLAIGASRAGDPAWTLACAALTMQTARHFVDFSYPAVQRQAIASVPQPPLEDPGDGTPPRRPAAPATAVKPKRAGADGPARRVLRLWRRLDRYPGVRWAKKAAQFPIGERFAAISLCAALFGPRVTLLVVLVWGGLANGYVVLGRLLRSLRRR